MIAALAIVAFVALERLAELAISLRNTRALMARGAIEHGAKHYPAIVALHLAWLASLILFLPRPVALYWPWLAAFAMLQVLRIWVMTSLGEWFSTRILTIEDAPLVETGLYRYLRHPNYWIVVGEIASLPLAFGEIWVALAFTLLNAAALAWRIRIEDGALASRRAAGANRTSNILSR